MEFIEPTPCLKIRKARYAITAHKATVIKNQIPLGLFYGEEILITSNERKKNKKANTKKKKKEDVTIK